MRQNLFIQILDSLSVKYTHAFATRYYEEHPDKNNLFGLSEMLHSYNIENVAAEIKNTKESFLSLECPFVAYVNHDFVLVRNCTDKTVTYTWFGKEISLSISEFLNEWSGIVLLFESTEKTIEPDYIKHKNENAQHKITIVSFLLLFLFMISFSLIGNDNMGIAYWGLWIVNLIGVLLCGILVSREMLGSDKYVNRVCSLFLKSSDCNGTLNSPASQFMGISWSVFGLGYFISMILSVTFHPDHIIYPETINVIALPYTIWSVWYQKHKAKQWCALCLGVQLTVWVFFFVSLFVVGYDYSQWAFIDFISTCSIYGVVILSIHFLVTLYVKEQRTRQWNYQLNSIRLNRSVFEILLKDQPRYPIDKNKGIRLGNAEAKKWITVISNPHCGPCAKIHPQIESLIQRCHEEICVQIILTSFGVELEPSAMLLIAMSQRSGETEFLQFLDDWYRDGRNMKEKYYRDYALDQNDEKMLACFQAQNEWLKLSKINATPTILVDGCLLPEGYEVKDLSYFID